MADPIFITHSTTSPSVATALGSPVSLAGTITGVRVFLPGGNLSGETQTFDLYVDGVAQTTGLLVPDGDNEDDVTGLSIAVTNDNSVRFHITGTVADTLPVPPYHFTITLAETHVALTGAQTVAGVKTFSSDPIIPDEAYGVGWNGSLEPPTKNAVYDKIETIGGGVSDGDKGDITVSGSGATWTIDNDVVTYAKMQNVSATSRILGRKTAAAGDTEEITIEEALNFIASLAQGDLLYHNGTNFVRLPAGTSGQFLKTLGTGANPAWDTIPGGGDLLSTNNLSDLANAATARTNLGLAIGTNVQAYDADLTTWAGITPGANVGTFLATPSSANLAAAVTDETGSGALVFGTAPTISNPKLDCDASAAADDTYSGITISGRNNSGGVTQWDAVYINGSSEFVIADANGSGTYPAIGLATTTETTGNPTTVITHGTVRNDAWAWTVGGVIYLSTTAGGLTQTAPSASGDKVQVMGIAISADEMLVMPQLTYITIT